jgi:hypothetical protein
MTAEDLLISIQEQVPDTTPEKAVEIYNILFDEPITMDDIDWEE